MDVRMNENMYVCMYACMCRMMSNALFLEIHSSRFHFCLCFRYESTLVEGNVVVPVETNMQFKTERAVPKVGVMLVGLGGNNGW